MKPTGIPFAVATNAQSGFATPSSASLCSGGQPLFLKLTTTNTANGCTPRTTRRQPSKYHETHFGHQSKFGYKDFFPRFTMEKFDPNEWVSLFEESGAKYIVPVAEMHDASAGGRSQEKGF